MSNVSLVVVPTAETFRRLHNIMLSAPLTLDFDTMMLPLDTQEAEVWEPNPHAVYDDVRIYTVTWTASEKGVSTLIANVTSAQIDKRRAQFGRPAGELKWVLKREVPPGRNVRVFLSSLIDILVYRELPFSFANEMVVST